MQSAFGIYSSEEAAMPSASVSTLDSSPALLEEEMYEVNQKRQKSAYNLHKSLQLLNESMGSPVGSPASQTSLSSYRKSAHSFSRLSNATADLSPIATPSRRYQASDMSFAAASINSTVTESISAITPQSTSFDSEVDYCLQTGKDLETDANQVVYTEFLRVRKEFPNHSQAFELVQQYRDICQDMARRIRNVHFNSTTEAQNPKISQLLSWLQEEAHTWDLVYKLYDDRYRKEEEMAEDIMGKYQSAMDVVQSFLDHNSTIRQAQIVVDWLENCALLELKESGNRLEYFTDCCGPWESTKQQLEHQQLNIGRLGPQDRPLITSLDPDAPLRQQAQLTDIDQQEAQRLALGVLAYIRAGGQKDAQDLCQRLGQPWLAAALDGWKLYHDPNYGMEGKSNTLEPSMGNPNRDLWKVVCWRLAKDKKLTPHLRAVYGCLSGNVREVLPMFTCWEDYLWAHLRAFVDQHVENELRLNLLHTRPWVKLPEEYQQNPLPLSKVFHDIEVYCQKSGTTIPSEMNTVQKNVILGMEGKLVEELSTLQYEESGMYPKHFQRFCAHLVLFFKSLTLEMSFCFYEKFMFYDQQRYFMDKCDRVLQNYVERLMTSKNTALVAAYTATLPTSSQVALYTKYCIDVTDFKERSDCISKGRAEGLPVDAVALQVVEKLRQQHCVVMEDDCDLNLADLTGGQLSKEDNVIINSIEWLLFNPSQCCQALRQANAIARTFLSAHKLAGCKAVYNKIPATILDDVHKFWSKLPSETNQLPPDDQNAVREYLCHKVYLDAQAHFSYWFRHFHHSKPQEPRPPGGRNFTERVAFEHKEQQYEAELQRWKTTVDTLSQSAKQKLYNVLLFPEGFGWMVDERESQEVEAQRQQQMRVIRRLCVPILVSVLHNLLHSTEHWTECLALADIIASEDRSLYKYFSQEELQKILHKLRESSLQLLTKNTDPLGYALE